LQDKAFHARRVRAVAANDRQHEAIANASEPTELHRILPTRRELQRAERGGEGAHPPRWSSDVETTPGRAVGGQYADHCQSSAATAAHHDPNSGGGLGIAG